MSVLESKRVLRRLELEAYASVISAFRAQGHLTQEKKTALNLLCQHLGISGERHHVEVRRAVCDEDLSNIADCISGIGTSRSWQPEGRRLARTNPRLVARHTYSSNLPAQTLTALTIGMGGVVGRATSGVDRGDGGGEPEKKIPPQVQSALRAIMTHPPTVGTTLRQRTVRNVSCQAQLQEKRETVGVQTDTMFSVDVHTVLKKEATEPLTCNQPPARNEYSPDLQNLSSNSVKRTLSLCVPDQTSAKKPCLMHTPSSSSSSNVSSTIVKQASPMHTSALPKCTSIPATIGVSAPMLVVAKSTSTVATPEGSRSVMNTHMLTSEVTNPIRTLSSNKDAIVGAKPMVTGSLFVQSPGSLPDPVQATHATSIHEPVSESSNAELTSLTQTQVLEVTTFPESNFQTSVSDVSISTVPHSLSLTEVDVAGMESMMPTPSLSVGSIEVTTLCSSLMSPDATNMHTFPTNTLPCEDTPATPLPADIEDGDLLDKITTELGVDSLDPALLNMADLFSLLQTDPGQPHSSQHVSDTTICDSTSVPEQSSLLLSPSLSSSIPNLHSLSELPSDKGTISLNAEGAASSTSIVLPTLSDSPTPQLSFLAGIPGELSDSDLLEDLPPELQETVHAILRSSNNNLQTWQ